MDDINEQPVTDVIPSDLNMVSKNEQLKFLKSLAERVVNKYILGSEKVASLLDKVHLAEIEDSEKKKRNPDARFKCRHPGCDKTYKYDGKRKREHEASHGLPPVQVLNYVNTGKKIIRRDDMFNYQSSFLEIGMLVKNFFDAVSEGDGVRVLRCWKFMLQYLRHDGVGSRKYALEALYMQCQVNALLSPRAAHRLIWNRFFKSKFGSGGNIPLDLALEHFNRIVKTLIKKIGSNGLNEKALNRHCKVLTTSKKMLDNFDEMCNVLKRSGHHVQQSRRNDLVKVVQTLVDNKAFEFTNGRTYAQFKQIKASLLEDFSISEMFKWINEHKKNIDLNRCAR